jgi:uncharacterized protein with PIN domain
MTEEEKNISPAKRAAVMRNLEKANERLAEQIGRKRCKKCNQYMNTVFSRAWNPLTKKLDNWRSGWKCFNCEDRKNGAATDTACGGAKKTL